MASVRDVNCCSCLFRSLHWHLLQGNMRLIGSDASVNRITLPQKMLQQLQRNKEKNATKQRQQQRRYKGPAVITCKRYKFNHHKGQTYSKFAPTTLASQGWKHYKSKGDYFTINANQGNPALELSTSGIKSFADLGLHSQLVAGLRAMKITKPTNIQALTIPHMLAMKNVLCAAETGSGKSLAYLLPILHSLLENENTFGSHTTLNQPYSIILTPSHELADQLQAVASQLAQHVPFNVLSVCGGRGTQKLLRECKVQPVDLLIATPGVLSKLFTNRIYSAGRLHHLVLDEADTLLDDSFNALTLRLLNKFKIQNEKEETEDGVVSLGTQVALVGATVPKSLEEILGSIVPVENIERITTKSLHRLMPHVPQKFLRIGPDDKPEMLLKLLQSNIKRSIPTLVFCNKTSTAGFLNVFLEENNVSHALLSGRVPPRVREGRFQKFQDEEVDVLLCTDIASRGLDTVRAQHVINYEFPDFMSDYIHRVGRVGRVGSQGTSFVMSFVAHKWDVELLWRIEASARQVTELHNVNANIKRKLVGLYEEKSRKNSESMMAPKLDKQQFIKQL